MAMGRRGRVGSISVAGTDVAAGAASEGHVERGATRRGLQAHGKAASE